MTLRTLGSKPTNRFLWICSTGWLVLAMAASGTAGAQEQPRLRKVLKLDVITVEGRIQKPQAFYILQRSSLNFGDLEKNETFVPKIVQSVNHEPF
jgi:hypothetical protein